MNVYCTACSQRVLADELCPHRHPVCQACCEDEHPLGYHDDEWGDGAA